MKAYNTLSTALQLSVAQNGGIQNWGIQNSENVDTGYDAYFSKYLQPYLRVRQLCPAGNSNSSCPSSYVTFYGPDKGGVELENPSETYMIFLQDGSVIYDVSYVYDYTSMGLVVDTNGVKGPNVWGRDIFEFWISYFEETGATKIYPRGLFYCTDWNDSNHRCENFIKMTLEEIKDGDEFGFIDCSCKSGTEDGICCGARLLLEGKMDY